MADSGDRSVGINLSCRENIVNTLANVRNSIKDSTKDLKYFQEVRKEALEKKTKLEIDIKEAQSNLKNLEKTIKDGSEEGKKAWADQKKSLEQYKSELKSLNQLYKDAEKGELNLTQSINKNANNRSIQEQGSSNLTMAGMGKLFLAGEIGNYLKDTTTQLALGQITRRYGGSSGEMASSVAGDALGLGTAGAMGGFAVGGPWGAAIGGAGGLIIGGVGGYLKGKEKQEVKIDDQFRDIVQSNLQEININQAQQSQVGRDLARIVEKDKISFGTLIGNQAKADKWLNNDVVKFGAETPFEQPDIKNLAKIMLGYNVKLENVIPMLKTVGDASSALGMSKENRDFTAVILGRMNQGGKAQWADINMLQDRAIPAMKYLTEALGKSYEEVKEGLSKGAISNEKALQIILKGMENDYKGNMEKQAQTLEGLESNLADLMNQRSQARGEGYAQEKKEGLKGQIEWQTNIAPIMHDAEKAIGAFEARLENLKQEKINIAIQTEILEDPDYKKAEEENNQSEMGRLIKQAEFKGRMDYLNSPEVQEQMKQEAELSKAMMENSGLKESTLDYGKSIADNFSKGFVEGVSINAQQDAEMMREYYQQAFQDYKIGLIPKILESKSKDEKDETKGHWLGKLFGHATGLDKVPYDNYPALLHEGERVITKADVNTSGGIQPTINMYNTITNDMDIDYVVKQLVNKLSNYNENWRRA